MNRIYKVIYSKARQCAMVVSELAKSNHKNSRKGAGHVGTPALARMVAAVLVAGTLTWGGVPGVSWAEDNTVTDSSNSEIVGSNNIVSGSRNQQVIGDHNTIIGRDLGNREENISDLTIGRGNYIRSADTGRNTWDSLKVIGNNNRADMEIGSAGGPAAGIVIGDNQNIDNIEDSIVIGSLSPDEQKEQVGEGKDKSDKYFVGLNSIVVGYHATSSKDASTVIGNRSKVSGNYQTVTGLRSTIEGNYYNQFNLFDGQSSNFASIYGSFNKIEDAVTDPRDMDGVGNSINGSMNVTSNARGTMIMGVGNTVKHSKGEFLIPKDDDSGISTQDLLLNGELATSDYALGRDITGKNLTFSADQTYAVMRDVWQRYMETSGGAVSVLGNSNTSDYAIRSQILGTNNMLKGAEGNISSYNTISGFSNTGENVKRTAIVGTGNTLKNSEDNVVIGDYHNLENGKHNVILGSMASEEKAVTKTAKAAWAATEDNLDGTYTYTVNEQVALKPNPKVIKNAVMVGYNTDVTQDGGVALGSDSIASTEAGKTGYDAKGKKHAKSDNDYAAWVSSDAAVSVGGADREVTYDVLDKDGKPVIDKATGKKKQETQIVKSTRQITNLAAGTQDTDAVNVAQLKSARTHFYSVNSEDATAGNYNNNGATGVNAIAAGVGASSDGDSSVAVGTNSRVASNGYSLTSIAIGKNAYVLNGTGQQEYEFGFDKDKWNKTPQGFSYKYDPKDGQKDAALADIAGGIAIGTNSYARTGSIDIGGRTMDGRTMAGMVVNETWVDPADGKTKVKNPATANIIDMTTVGTNSYNKGLMATIVGSYSINTGDFNGKGGFNSLYYGSQNMGSTIVGSLNQNRSLGKGGTSGVANSIIGVANVAEGANGALIFGAGNKVSNSIGSIYGFDGNYGANTVDDLVDSLSSAVKESESGGSTLVIGGGNTADYTQRTQLIGVNNTITGTSKNISEYNMVDGFNTKANNISHVYTIGYRNDFNNENNSIVIGDYHQLTNGKNNIVIGSYDGSYQPADEYAKTPEKTTYLTNDKLEDAVILGHNADATVNGGVALGYGSVASTKEGVPGYDPLTGNQSTSTDDIKWKSNWAAVSIGDSAHTRQITNLAAGFNDTDAVNVAQLKAVAEKIGPAVNFVAGDGISIVNKDGVYTISANIKGGSTPTDDVKVDPEKPGEGGNTSGSTTDTPVTPVDPGNTGNTDNSGNTGNTENPGNTDNPSNGSGLIITAKTKPTHFGADSGEAIAVKPGETLAINGDTTNITTTASDHGIIVSLKKDIAVDSVTAGDTKMTRDGLTITGGPSVTQSGINAGHKKITNVADGNISKDSKDAINGSQLYNETRVAKDGNFVKQANTAGENLSALDNQVTSNTQNINYLNGRVGELGDRINKVGAGAAALAALHPLDFDPDDKWDFAAGVGNYRNATAAAVGLFYRPNERTMFNLGWTMGDNRNMVNGGFSVKFGKSNKYVKYSKAEMASVIDSQSREIAELKAKDAQNAKDNAEMRAEIEALKKKVEALAAKK